MCSYASFQLLRVSREEIEKKEKEMMGEKKLMEGQQGDEEEESKCSHHVKLFTGIVFVIILLGCEYFLSHLLDKVKWKKKRH